MSDERHELILVCPRRRHSRKHGLLAFATTSAPSSPSKGMAAVMHSKPFLELGTGQCAMQGTMERLKERYVCVCFHIIQVYVLSFFFLRLTPRVSSHDNIRRLRLSLDTRGECDFNDLKIAIVRGNQILFPQQGRIIRTGPCIEWVSLIFFG